ncbi:MAG TPA: hypothetical protein VEY51_07295 [Chondromyces sp.]|nr:hypothetical protein [Chondromyces sp.]
MFKENDVIIYHNQKYRIVRLDEAGYCDIERLTPPTLVELTHVKDLKGCKILSSK